MTRAFVTEGPGEVRCTEIDAPSSAGAEVELEAALFGALDARVIRGEGAARVGRGPTYPHVLGSSAVGRLRRPDEACRRAGLEAGARVVVSGTIGCGDCPRCAAGEEHLCAGVRVAGVDDADTGRLRQVLSVPGRLLYRVGPGVDALRAAMVSEVAAAVRAVRCSGIERGETVAIVGLEAPGLHAIRVARACGAASVHGVDADARARARARDLGADLVFAPDEYPAWIGGNFERAPMRVVQLASAPGQVGLALQVAGRRGVVVAAGIPDEDPVVLPEYYRNAIHRELTLVGTCTAGRQDWLDAVDLVEQEEAPPPEPAVEVRLTEAGAAYLARAARAPSLRGRVLVTA